MTGTAPDARDLDYATLLQRVAHLEAQRRIHHAATNSLDLIPMLNAVVATINDVMVSDACSIYLYDERDKTLVRSAVTGMSQEAMAATSLQIGEGITGRAAATRRLIATTDTNMGMDAATAPLESEELHMQVSVPMEVRAVTKLIGVFNLSFPATHELTAQDREFLGTIAGELAIAIDHALLYDAAGVALIRKVEELQTLQLVTTAVTSTLDLTQVLETIAQQAAALGSADMVSIYELSTDGEELHLLAGYETGAGGSARVAEEVRREAVRRAMKATQGGTEATESLLTSDPAEADDDEGTVFCMPLCTAHGTIGGICLHFHDGTGPAPEQMDLLRSFSNTAAIAIEQARLYDDARRALMSTSALLQEMHHRVRNNLQTVAALLSMHVRRAGNEPWAWPLREAVNRIRSIAAVHDLLTREDIGVTTVNEVAKLVTNEASTTLVPPGAEYIFSVEGPPAIVSSREATVLAILINELVANAVLHGLEGRTQGTVRVEIALNAGTVMVHVEDDGHGFPPGFRADHDGGLGLQITQNLVSTDLKGEVSLERSALGGGAVVITFTPRLVAAEQFGVM